MIASDPEFEDRSVRTGSRGRSTTTRARAPLPVRRRAAAGSLQSISTRPASPATSEARACAAGILDSERWTPGLRPLPDLLSRDELVARSAAEIEASCLLELGGGPIDVRILFFPGRGVRSPRARRHEDARRFGNGFLCVGGAVRASPSPSRRPRAGFPARSRDGRGGVITGGSTWYVQAIYRDRGAARPGSTPVDAIAITVALGAKGLRQSHEHRAWRAFPFHLESRSS
jgi:hypothetical protein